jgi:hypothetical protein
MQGRGGNLGFQLLPIESWGMEKDEEHKANPSK